ncbi:hypothetical protein ACE1SV_25140 [Streptomyces sp. E-15]
MPRFSIIVPSHGVAGRLSQALDSVLGQSFGDLQLIPVCDAPDAPAAEVAAGYAGRDRRVTPVHSPPSAGLGGARNAGMRAATGAYLLFLDGDDLLLPGALAALDARLAETGGVDVLYAEHERAPWWEGEPTNPAAPLLARAPKGAFAPAELPELTGVLLPAWGTLYRRAFLTERELTFPDGHFTDLGWSGLTGVAAGRIAVLRRAVVRHRLRRQGSRLNLPGPHQHTLLDQVERVLTGAAGHALPAERTAPLFDQLFALVLKTASRPERLLTGHRAFFRRAARLYRRYRPAGHRVPDGSLGVQHRLLAAGAYTAFRALRGTNRAAGAAAGCPARTCCAPGCATPATCAARSTRTSPCTAPTGAAATPATRPRSTPGPGNSPRTSARCSWSRRAGNTPCRGTSSTR